MKKLLSLLGLVSLLATTFISSVTPAAFAYTSFSDVSDDHPYADAIYYLQDKDIVSGYSDGTFMPDSTISRAEFMKIVLGASDYGFEGTNCFSDVKDEWFSPYICKAKSLSLVDGYSDGTFRPSKEISFVEGAKVAVSILQLQKEGEGENWFEPYVRALETVNSIPGSVKNFDSKLTRGEMADIIYRVHSGNYYKLSNTYDGLKNGLPPRMNLKQFASCDDIKTYMKDTSYGEVILYDKMMDLPSALPSAESAVMTKGGGGEDVAHSETNVQVAGVDEADTVKNDGEYVYYLRNSEVKIAKAYPVSAMDEVATVTFKDENFWPSEMYVGGNRLVVVGNSYENTWGSYVKMEIMPPIYNGSKSVVYIYDVTSKSSPKLLRQLEFDGNYSTSRKIGNILYIVNEKNNYYWNRDAELNDADVVPSYSDSATGKAGLMTACSNVRYFPGSESPDYLTVTAVSIATKNAPVKSEVLIGDSGTVYASKDNLYVIEKSWSPWLWSSAKGWQDESVIHKFGLNGGNVEYKASNTLNGDVLNQFSMDEYSGNFRVATTNGSTWGASTSENNLYVYNRNLDLVGKLEGLAKSEQIYSARFVGNRAYLVTFKRIDPLFVIDLSNAYAPAVLGELKIPGVSDYLHPYDENHIIGFGLDTAQPSAADMRQMGTDFFWYQGIKMSMFDVTDVKNPKELHKIYLGDRGTYSELLYNHKALLFDKEKGIMAFPATVAKISDIDKNDPSVPTWWKYGDYTAQGAYVYSVSLADGFKLKGVISHYNDYDKEYNQNYDYTKYVERIMYIGDYFYTVSNYALMANNISDLKKVETVKW